MVIKEQNSIYLSINQSCYATVLEHVRQLETTNIVYIQIYFMNIKCYLCSANSSYKNYRKAIKIKVNVVQNYRGRFYRMDRNGA